MAISKEEYGDDYKTHLLEQYKLYVEMADRISNRRQAANSFFLSVNTAIIALVGYLNSGSKAPSEFYFLVSISGIVLCFMWYKLLCSYKNMNSVKFKVIQEIEAQLPFAPYYMEWEKLGKGKKSKLYLPFTRVEMFIPWVFLAIHFVFVLSNVCAYVSDLGLS